MQLSRNRNEPGLAGTRAVSVERVTFAEDLSRWATDALEALPQETQELLEKITTREIDLQPAAQLRHADSFVKVVQLFDRSPADSEAPLFRVWWAGC
mmetsp:Transcript_50352/g.139441  ORF Transcript_50352/g.139441 Transcript_50352/m.139441 type:complete len:97 (+) Transcript_50352:2-292(+)